jgi:hypothetical protein
VASGERIVPGERIQVPAGSTLLLCWGIGADVSGQVVIAGPAAIVVTSSGAIENERAESERVLSATPRRALSQSEARDAEWRAAQAALGAGDRPRAEGHLRMLLGPAVPVGLREPAAFALAELELARGEKGEARRRLRALQGSRDAELAADAVFLEARAEDLPTERAALYARFLESGPPSPYRERAAVDEALSLLEAGDVAAACARAAALRASGPLPAVAAGPWARLERQLGAEGCDR